MDGRGRPWTGSRVRWLVVANGLGLALAAVSTYRIAGLSTMDAQLSWFNLGLAGLFLAGAFNGEFLVRSRRQVRQALGTGAPCPPRSWVPSGGATADLALLAAPGMTAYHSLQCPLVVGKGAVDASRAQHERAGRTACEACEP